jgi:pimeloyl-ACP methyl ester carboxylesterase
VLEHVGPSVLLVHSAAGAVGFAAARARPELMTALVVVEPTGCPVQSSEIAPLPFLAIYGDYIDSRRQTGRLQSCQTTRDLVAAAGYPAEFISYPAIDVRGNTHLLMQDDNSADIFADVLAWLEQTVWN